MTRIKICGLTSVDDARLVRGSGADYAGVVMFCPKSRRNTAPEAAKKIIAALGGGVRSVAVVVSPTAEQIKSIEDCGFDIVQIHGGLSDDVYNVCRLPIFKAFNVNDMNEAASLGEKDKITGFVFDAAQPGSGKTFNWSAIPELADDRRLVILAGGLTPQNVKDAINSVHPDIVDVSSGVENDNGIGKSPEKVTAFINAARSL